MQTLTNSITVIERAEHPCVLLLYLLKSKLVEIVEQQGYSNIEIDSECLIDYSGPIFLSGSVFDMHTKSLTVLEADVPKEELLIINNKFPEWLVRLKNNSDKGNVLLIKNFDKISLEDQRRFVEIICNIFYCFVEQL